MCKPIIPHLDSPCTVIIILYYKGIISKENILYLGQIESNKLILCKSEPAPGLILKPRSALILSLIKRIQSIKTCRVGFFAIANRYCHTPSGNIAYKDNTISQYMGIIYGDAVHNVGSTVSLNTVKQYLSRDRILKIFEFKDQILIFLILNLCHVYI